MNNTSEAQPRFGGKAFQPLRWQPLPHMQQYLAELAGGDTVRSEGYLRGVRVGLARFAVWAITQDVWHPEEITREVLLHYQASLVSARTERGELLTASYQQQLMRWLRGWVHWLANNGYLPRNPWVGIKLGRLPRAAVPMQAEEIELMIAAHWQQAFSVPPFEFHRRETLLGLLFVTGLRIHEVASLAVNQVGPLQHAIAVQRGPSQYGMTVPLTGTMKTVINRWMRIRASHAETSTPALLVGRTGKPLTTAQLAGIVIDCAGLAGARVTVGRLQATLGARRPLDELPRLERALRGRSSVRS
jgi:site-specific recombinase XerD